MNKKDCEELFVDVDKKARERARYLADIVIVLIFISIAGLVLYAVCYYYYYYISQSLGLTVFYGIGMGLVIGFIVLTFCCCIKDKIEEYFYNKIGERIRTIYSSYHPIFRPVIKCSTDFIRQGNKIIVYLANEGNVKIRVKKVLLYGKLSTLTGDLPLVTKYVNVVLNPGEIKTVEIDVGDLADKIIKASAEIDVV